MRVCKVLIVENDDFVRELLGEVFNHEGFLFTSVANGADMLEKLDEDDYDIAVIDLTLPGDKDGFALAEIACTQGCSVILVTGDPRHAPRLEQSGHVYLLKPFRMHQLTALVDQVLTKAATECVRRRRRDGSSFQPRSA
jgi:DNA-binding response OmpR family regulator